VRQAQLAGVQLADLEASARATAATLAIAVLGCHCATQSQGPEQARLVVDRPLGGDCLFQQPFAKTSLSASK
jgi:hypothetical protein